ncbi:MAG: hypothetical protein IV100_19555 [Myxococcales bacterium]|nr:hypothetical protein [Myxococcales bacterium]
MSNPSSDGSRPTEALRRATPADNTALCEVFRRVTMDADLHLAVERDPDYFALYDLQGCPYYAMAFDMDGKVEASGSFVARDAWLGGDSPGRIGYACDLRLTPAVRGGRFLGEWMGVGFRDAARTIGFDYAYTAVIASNRAAMKALAERSPRYPGKPVYTPHSRFRILNVLFTFKKSPRPSAFRVRPATIDDLAIITDRLRADHRHRPFGYVIGDATLPGTLARWPGLRIEDFLLAFDGGDRLVGVTAVWNANPVKRYRVLGYRGQMKVVRAGFNALAFVTGATPLPPPGALMSYFYLTHTSVAGDDPAVMAALLDRVYADRHGKGFTFFSAFVMDDDPMARAFERYQTTSLPASLFLMTAPGAAIPTLPVGRPGFEMCLA